MQPFSGKVGSLKVEKMLIIYKTIIEEWFTWRIDFNGYEIPSIAMAKAGRTLGKKKVQLFS